jgi:DNA polymerase III alpha subunit (gram-positive type)
MEYVRKNKVGKPLKQEDIDEMKKHGVPDYFIESCKKIRYLFPRAHATAYVMGRFPCGLVQVLSSAGVLRDLFHRALR